MYLQLYKNKEVPDISLNIYVYAYSICSCSIINTCFVGNVCGLLDNVSSLVEEYNI